MRNALLLDAGSAGPFDWSPATVPVDYMLERGPPDRRFVDVVDRLKLVTLPSDWDRAVAIGRHLLSSKQKLVGGPIKADLAETHRRIVDRGEGYCGDFVDVFTALALASGIPVRAWAFSFDGFGGHGHIFNEIWDAQAGRWMMIDVFNNYYVAGSDGAPLSALAFRAALQANATNLRMLPVDRDARPMFKYEERAWEFYRRGLAEWYLWWGNNIFSYDRALLVRTLSGVSRSLEQLGGIAQDVHPHIRVVATSDNQPQRDALRRLQLHLLVVLAVGVLAVCVLVMSLVGWARSGRDEATRGIA